jgi:glyoxylase-like metal-dependent hydrolase (beta-lactamase superfamily II)
MPKRVLMKENDRLFKTLEKLDTIALDDKIYLIIGKNQGTFPYSNSLLIADKQIVLIDSGLGKEIIEPIKDFVDILINSHYHIDHILGNHLFKELWVIEEEAGVTSSFDRYKQFAGIKGTTVEEEWLSWFQLFFEFVPSTNTRTFEPNEVFKFGDTTWKAVHTPGHTPGHCCFYEPSRKIMYATDIDLASFGPWYANPNSNLPEFIDSIKKMQDYDIDVVCTSHTPPQRDNIREAFEKYLNVIFERDERILNLLEKEMTVAELEAKDIIYKKDHKKFKTFAWFEQNMIEKHLELLIEAGKVERVGDRYQAI